MLEDRTLEGHILSIIQNHEILEQSELQKLLKERGYEIPQATLSRRLKKLKIAKVSGVYKAVDFNQPHFPLILNMQVSDFGLIVLHTYPGHGNSLAYFLDQKYVAYSYNAPKNNSPKKSGIIGTIAGDDTVLLIVKSKEDLKTVVDLISKDFPYLGVS
ncbi:MAG: ArgR family transcriptional regulator [Alphaproteobacteria bacterium 16-39-46]|nr:MAG: ArgR family transcriptional regulator [Alphaproteobacteria bacterium 16-39-46]OZA43323.1 MAG: ArgR family transcriptional regulator [Alphaproteobacteria bacterium 17-39-52]HQS83927.1 ArgR family transcriptional regulator [Alphaproteobacteria bacterium]HQS93787.1 ArgR family transcriptional regulator [Alphaproteobacteria bacterium]